MARTELTPIDAPGNYADDGTALTFTAADVSNKNCFASTGRELVLAKNDDASSQTVTIDSAEDEYGREGDISADSITAGDTHVYGPFPVKGWRQTDGMINLEASDADVKFCVIRLP